MSESMNNMFRLHEDPALFREAVSFTAAETGFSSRLIEKDYFCSLLLEYLSRQVRNPLVFKGGTCLAKIHTGFYRLSEDLDFVIPTPLKATRRDRGRKAAGTKKLFSELPTQLPCFSKTETFEGRNESKQYLGCLGYSSMVSGQTETIKLEVSLREPLLLPAIEGTVKTVLRNPVSGQTMLPEFQVPAIALSEAMAEKLRAALTRREPAIRDLFDLDYAAKHLKLRFDDTALIDLLRAKLSVSGNKMVEFGSDLLALLMAQSAARLKPVLRKRDFETFDLESCFAQVAALTKVL